MNTALLTFAALLGLAALMVFAQWGAKRLTGVFNFRPFNCRACFTFWMTIVALIPWSIALPGHLTPQDALNVLIFSFINYLYIKTKIEVYD